MFTFALVPSIHSYVRITLVVAVVLLSLPPLYTSVILNVTSLSLLRSEQCPSGWASCPTSTRSALPVAWQAAPSTLLQLDDWLASAGMLAGHSDTLRLRRAEVQFALGHAREAAALLQPVTLGLSDNGESHYFAAAHSRLLTPGTYENYLVGAYQLREEGKWQESVNAFRLALAYGAEYMTADDHKAYLATLAHQFAQSSENTAIPARDSYLAGIYFGLSGQWRDAKEWLERAQQSRGWEQMTISDRGRALTFIGLAREATSDYDAARNAYSEAITTAPALVEPRILLLALLQKLDKSTETEQVQAAINELGPTYELGGSDSGNDSSKSPTLPSNWKLVGYDVDEESLAAGGQMDIWLWWKAPIGEEEARDSTWINTGRYWLQRQSVVNLVPNPGLEWGIREDGFPVGIYPMWDVRFGNVSVEETDGPDAKSHVLRMQQILGIAAIMSKPRPVDSQAFYLAGTWIRTDKVGSVGLRCSEQEGFGFHASMAQAEDVAEQSWQHLTYFGQTKPDPMTNMCVFAFFAEAGGTTQWDQTMLVRLSQLP
jgi:tetratricopeptide (TPR) repeat protein